MHLYSLCCCKADNLLLRRENKKRRERRKLNCELYTENVCVRWSGDGRDCAAATLSLDPGHHLLIVKTTKDNKKTCYHINQLAFVAHGNKPKETGKIRKYLNRPEEEVIGAQCLSLYFDPWPWREVNLVLATPQTADLWKRNLQKLKDGAVPMFPDIGSGRPTSTIEYWLRCQYLELQKQNGGMVHVIMALGSFAELRLFKAYKILQDLIEPDPELKSLVEQEVDNVSFEVFQALYFTHMAKQRPDLLQIYKAHCSTSCDPGSSVPLVNPQPLSLLKAGATGRRRSSLGMINFKGWHSASKAVKQVKEREESEPPVQKMSKEAFFKFLTATQGLKVTEQQVEQIIRTYDLVPDSLPVTMLSLKGFTHYMLSQEAAAPYERGVVNQDMSKPLHDYFIASSHNTYLTGHQFHGESSVHMYTLILCSGCRCVELDCWDGEGGEPIIYHGHTLTSKIKFKDVVDVIGDHAFTASPYPLILSLENHCSVPQQVKMVEYMKAAFGDKLLTQPVRGGLEQLPSPEELKYKILIKNRKLAPPTSSEESVSLEPAQSKSKALISFPSPGSSPLLGGRFSRGSSSTSLPPLPITPYNLSPTLTSSPLTLSPSFTPSPLTPSPTSTSPHLTFPPTSPLQNSYTAPSRKLSDSVSPHSPTTPTMFTILEEADSCFVPAESESSLKTCKLTECSANFDEAPSDGLAKDSSSSVHSKELEGEGKKPATMNDAASSSVILPATEHVQSSRPVFSRMEFHQKQQDLTTVDTPSLLTVQGLNYTRSKSCPNSELYGSESDLQPHRPLSRTVSMDSVGLMEWWTSTQAGLDKPSPSDEETKTQSEPHPEVDGERSHKRNSSLPIHIQRAFPELAAPTRPKSPLVLHELRSTAELCKRNSVTSLEGGGERGMASNESADLETLKRSLYNRRRHGSLGVSILQAKNSSELSSPYPSPTLTESSSSSCPDTAEAVYQSKDIARELSDLVVYLEPVKFSGFKAGGEERRSTEMYSLSENVAKKVSKKSPLDFISFNSGHLSRMYPSATRITSSNYNPAPFWMLGCQMAALNYQTNDTPMQQYMSVFSQNGSSGYILRPQSLMENAKKYLRGEELVATTAVTITLISGQHLRGVDHNRLPSAEMEILGAPYDTAKVRCHASSVSGVCALWSAGNVLQARVGAGEVAVVKFTVYSDKNQDNVLCCHVIPLSTISMGYQHVYFPEQEGVSPSPPPSLFIHAQMKESSEHLVEVCPKPDESAVESRSNYHQDDQTACEELKGGHVISGKAHRVDHVINVEDQVINVEVCVSEVEEHTISVCVSEGEVVSDFIQKVIDQVGLSGDVNDYIAVTPTDEDDIILESCDPFPMEGSLRLENAPGNSQPQLATVPISFSDLPGVDVDTITLFAVSTTTASELLFSSVARLGDDVTTICPQLSDREDEDEIQQYFYFVLADQSAEGIQLHRDTLDNEALILPLFREPGQCLVLKVKSQVTLSQDHTPTQSQDLTTHSQSHSTHTILSHPLSSVSMNTESTGARCNHHRSSSSSETSNQMERPQSVVFRSVEACDSEGVGGGSFICHTSLDTDSCYTRKHSTGEKQEPFTSTKVRPVSPEVAKHYIEAYYKKLEARLAQLKVAKLVSKKTKKALLPKRAVSHTDVQRQAMNGRRLHHPRRMSVDVDLLLGQNKASKLLVRTASFKEKTEVSNHSSSPVYYTDLDAAAMQYKNRPLNSQ